MAEGTKRLMLDEHWHIPDGNSTMMDGLMRMGRKHDARLHLTEAEEERLLAEVKHLDILLARLRDHGEMKERDSEKTLARWEGEGGYCS